MAPIGSGSSALSAGLGPAGVIAEVSKKIGEAIAEGTKARDTGNMRIDYQTNVTQNGPLARENAEAIRASQQQRIDNQYTGASIGALFGPIGALAGHFAGSLLSNAPRAIIEANSSSGKIDPTDTHIASSLSIRNPSGVSTMKDTVNDGIPIPTGAA